jgi:hypothetical protein
MIRFLSLKNIYIRYTAITLALVYITLEARENNDFIIFLSASSDILHKTNAYLALYKGCYHYYYSPFFAVLLFPFTLIPAYAAKLIWLALNLFFVFRTWKAMAFFLDRRVFNEWQKLAFTVACFLFVLRFMIENFHCGQMTVFILFLSMEGIYRIMTGRYWFGALLISLAINIKLLPLLLIPYLLYRRYLKASAWLLLFLVCWLILPAAVTGFSFNNVLLKSWWALINPTNKEHVIDTAERSFHSLSSWLPTLLQDHVGDPHVLLIKRNVANLDPGIIAVILNSLRIALVLFGLFFLRSWPLKRASSKLNAFWELSFIFLLVPLIFPHQQHYAFYFMLPAGTYLCYYISSRVVSLPGALAVKKTRFLLAGFVLVFLCNNLQLILGEFGPYYEHFKVITYGALLMVVLLAMSGPGEIPVRKEEDERGESFY